MAKVNLDNECASDVIGSEAAPFEFYLFRDLLGESLFEVLREDVKRVDFEPKNNDLYKFQQSKDLLCQLEAASVPPSILDFGKLMLHQVKPHLEKLTNLKLSSERFDITASRYGDGDYLLCHNDDIKDTTKKHARALAFVYYLNGTAFLPDNGGALVLYKSDDKGEPAEGSHRISPLPNSLVIFRTSSKSWHCVEEVHKRADRLSINGWFHLEELPAAVGRSKQQQQEPTEVEACPYTFVRPSALDERLERFFKDCISGDYLMEKTCYLVRRKFKKASEINLTNFLVKEKYHEMCAELKKATGDESNLETVGPYNKRHYRRIQAERLPQICRDLFDAFRSELFFMLLSRLTGLDLQPPSLAHQDDLVPGDSSDEDPEDMDDDEAEDDEDAVEESAEEESAEGESDEDEEGQQESREDTLKRKRDAGPSGSKETESKPTSKRKRVSDPLARLEFRHLEPGSYTLVHDYAYETNEKSALDVVLHFNHDFEVNFEDGGYIAYIDGSNDDRDDDEPQDPDDNELLSIEPKSNCLSLVYREEGTCRFLKYISKSHKSSYQDLSCVYYEKPDDLLSQSIDDAKGD